MSVLITLEKFGFDIFYWKLPNIKEKKETNFSMKNNIISMKNDQFSMKNDHCFNEKQPISLKNCHVSMKNNPFSMKYKLYFENI